MRINQASEACQLIRAWECNPEVQTIAARTCRAGSSTCRKRAERSQVCRLPQRDTVAVVVCNQYAFAIEGSSGRSIQTVAVERCQHEGACQRIARGVFDAHDSHVGEVKVGNPDIGAIKDRNLGSKSSGDCLSNAAVSIE